MAEELRNVYNEIFVTQLTDNIKRVYDDFNSQKCFDLIFKEDWQTLALKERMRRITVSLHQTLPGDYISALSILYKVAPQFSNGLTGIIFPDYVEQYGLEEWEISLQALEFFTRYSTSEFAVRPFLIKNVDEMLNQMYNWSKNDNEHVRRLASEGSRPRLPWGLSVPYLKANPERTIPILENLKEDESLYVRKSVANHLNDISYTNPDLVIEIARRWHGKHPYTDWIIKHACRTLLKKGDQRALSLFGFEEDEKIEVKDIGLERDTILIGETLEFSFTIVSQKTMPIRIEYGIDYVKSKGNRSRKIFMISSFTINQNEGRTFSKKQSFKDLTTRKHYKGIHTLSIIVNGIVKATIDFEVK
ncbi:DNA alkylation repair protein [Neobacillus sp. D3-1R]|uniref:DNA alkylation repair protein n=1 Tax=Neobacillus sp. D3-1R TaxID=3445778 RepID=UPI003FA0BBE6